MVLAFPIKQHSFPNTVKQTILLLLFPLVLAMQCKKSNKSPSSGTSAPIDLDVTVLASGLNHPWEILWGPDNFIWMTEREGKISRVNPANGTVELLLVIPDVIAQGEGGLLGMVLHPSFSVTPHVFVVYNFNSGSGYREKVVRYTYDGSTLVNPVTILSGINASTIHNGSRLLIIDNKLYISTGDAANANSAQNTSSLNGKLLRLNLDGTIPSDNPVPGNPYWTYGHRNAQGMVYANNKIYISEHGPSSDDEVNIIERGKNYGWPDVMGFCDNNSERDYCNSNKDPIQAWTPTIAPCGMDYYSGSQIPQWKNSLLLTTLKDARLYQLKLDASFTNVTSVNEYFANDYGRLRDICITPTGIVYISTSNGRNDKILAIKAK